MADDARPRGKALERPEGELAQLAKVDDSLIAEGRKAWRRDAPAKLRDLIDAKRDAEDKPESRRQRDRRDKLILWLIFTRVYRLKGRVVPRKEVRAGVDKVVAAAKLESEALGDRLKAGSLDLPGWQRGMEDLIRRTHAATGAIGAGGRLQLGTEDRKALAKRIRFQLKQLAGFAKEIEGGLPLDGKFESRAAMYAGAATGAYEAILRAGDKRGGFLWERRLRHSSESCGECIGYAARGWQPIGTLPDIGEECSCLSNCACSFERSRAKIRPDDDGKPTMPGELNLDAEKCAKRRRIAARMGVNAIPMRVVLKPDAAPADKATLVSASGTLAGSDAAALDRINAILGKEGDGRLKADQVHVRTMEAGNTNFVGDRWMFLDKSTLKNVAGKAADGFAFMNSHRTGGLSAPAELPYGRTFAGRMETWATPGGGTFRRSLVQVYMLRGAEPNGSAGPSTDAIAQGIDAGTLFDVSLGLYDGWQKCDVCGNDLTARDDTGNRICSHYPGTTFKMTRDEKRKQVARGVPGGVASFTLVDAMPSEVSAVYDGAVPGAGFRLALDAARSGVLPDHVLHQLRSAYADLIPTRGRAAAPFQLAPKGSAMTLRQLLQKLGLAHANADEIDLDSEIEDEGDDFAPKPAPPPAPADPKPSPAMVALQAQLAETNRRLAEEKTAREESERKRKEEARTNLLNGFKADAGRFIGELKTADKLTGLQSTILGDLYVQLATDDADHPVEGYSRLNKLKSLATEAKPHNLTKPIVAGNGRKPETEILSNEGDGAYNPESKAKAQNDAYFARGKRTAAAAP